jgi:hypothetical protein
MPFGRMFSRKAQDKEQQQKSTQSNIGYKRATLENCVFTKNLKKEYGWEIPIWKRPSIKPGKNSLFCKKIRNL